MEASARRELHQIDVEPIDDPVAEFMAVVAEGRTVKNVLAARAAAAPADQLHAAMRAYERALERSADLLERYLRLGLDARAAAMNDGQVATLAEVIERLVNHLPLSWEDREEGRRFAGELLRSIDPVTGQLPPAQPSDAVPATSLTLPSPAPVVPSEPAPVGDGPSDPVRGRRRHVDEVEEPAPAEPVAEPPRATGRPTATEWLNAPWTNGSTP